MCEIFTHNLAIGHLDSPKVCAATLLQCIENYFAIIYVTPWNKIKSNPEVPEDSHPYSKVGLSPTLPFFSNFYLSFLFIFLLDFNLCLSQPKPTTWEWRECMRWCSVCDWVWNERYIDWALRLPDCLPSDCFILSVKWRCRAQTIPLWLHGCFCSIHWSSQVKGILHSTKI